jgi:hypothetical protein
VTGFIHDSHIKEVRIVSRKQPGYLVFCLMAALSLACGAPPAEKSTDGPDATVKKGTSYDDLVSLFNEWREFQKPKAADGVPDYTPTGMAAQRKELDVYRRRLAAIDASAWPLARDPPAPRLFRQPPRSHQAPAATRQGR